MSKAVVFLFVIGLMISVVTAWWSTNSPLRFPDDCNSEALRTFATTCGLSEHSMGNHYILRDPKSNDINNIVIVIPDDLQDFGMCEKIVRDLNERCNKDYFDY
ncbi:uncharacterized protein LOC127867056 isoform X5 [Dreissena polymorpha]|uniref:Uncharacterized protein n=1 Tax=Dreissena polymorpha TaxID=45954 RepID=A0A9D4LVK3_DREPO|nr:uncharacterized protein LOC127867056 isoform X5 [Dreissena polymorpha]KAH3865478.1 hypothetical protein DPMN_028517 [Dreissena polymorpha]